MELLTPNATPRADKPADKTRSDPESQLVIYAALVPEVDVRCPRHLRNLSRSLPFLSSSTVLLTL